MKQKQLLAGISAGLISLGLAGNADAQLLSRLGGLAYYDDQANLTWLADANYAQTSGYATANVNGLGFNTNTINANGTMGWQAANDWAAQLTVGGVGGWRLATTLQPDASCSSQSNQGASFPLQGASMGCTGSEMGNLFNVEGISATAPGPFSNVQGDNYWSGTEFAPNTSTAWVFDFYDGVQSSGSKKFSFDAWAVQSGDVSTVPVPAAVWLFGSGLLGLVGVARNKTV